MHTPPVWKQVTGGTRSLGVAVPDGPAPFPDTPRPRPDTSPPRTHQLFLTLDHSKCGFVAVAILPARVPVSWFLREEVAFPSVQQPVLRAGRFALDAALGGCRERRDSVAASTESLCLAPKNPTSPVFGDHQSFISGEGLSQCLAGRRLETT